MKRFFILLLLALTLSIPALADVIFAFEVVSYDVFSGKTINIAVVAQGTDEKLTYIWESSDEKIATVKNGAVKGLSGGTATITCTATLNSGESYTASCLVNVNVPIKSIKVTDKNVEVAPDNAPESANTFSPNIIFTPQDATNKDIEWSSSSIYVASVSPTGVVRGRSPGKAIITGESKDGSGKKVSYNVTVPNIYLSADNITISEDASVELEYAYGQHGRMCYYKIDGDCFIIYKSKNVDTNGLKERGTINIVPVKSGSGSISFYRETKLIETVKIKVEKSAVRDNDSYPKMDLETTSVLKNANLGKQVQLRGTMLSYDELEIESFVHRKIPGDYYLLFDWNNKHTVKKKLFLGEMLSHDEYFKVGASSKPYSGVVYAYMDGKLRQYFAFEYALAALMTAGNTYTVYGTIDHYISYTTETGLSYEVPYLTNVVIKE